jgi:methionyl aminopeptidase
MIIRSVQELKRYQQAADKSIKILKKLFDATIEGATPQQIDNLADQECQKMGVSPCFKGVGPKNNKYRWATCISVNDTVVHGIPENEPLKKGDLVKVDFGINDQGWITDHCFSKSIAKPSSADQELLTVARKAIIAGAKLAIVGKKTGDIGAKMQEIIEKANFSVVKEFVGHGVGHSLHDGPQLPAYGRKGTGVDLKEGMVLCVEAQVLASQSDRVYVDDNGWTVKTVDGAKAAMFEYMVIVGKKEAIFLTDTRDWPLF